MMNKSVKVFIAIALALCSFFGVSKVTTNPDSFINAETIEYLDTNHKNVLALTATAAGLSAAITLMPGDIGTPIAEKLADFGTYFIIIMSAVFLEKYLLIVTGYVTFKFLIPIACLVYIYYLYSNNIHYMKMASKLFLLGIALYIVIPASVQVSHIIEGTYETSIQETIDIAETTTEQIEENKEDEGVLQNIFNNITATGTNVKDEAGNIINSYVQSFAIMFVISCIFPVLILLFFIWIIKIILGVQAPPKMFHTEE